MKTQLTDLGFIQEASWYEYELETCTLVVESHTGNVFVDDHTGDSVMIAQHATIEQITNILKALQI